MILQPQPGLDLHEAMTNGVMTTTIGYIEGGYTGQGSAAAITPRREAFSQSRPY